MYEVSTKSELPEIVPPAVAYVRDEADYYFLFPEGWRKVDNGFLHTDTQEIPNECAAALPNATYQQMIELYYGLTAAPLVETEVPSGKVVSDRGKLFCVQDQVKPFNWLGRQIRKIGVEVLKEGTPGVHIQDPAYRENFHQWQPEPIGFVICNGATKGDMSFKCSVLPGSVATKINEDCQYVQFGQPSTFDEPGPCLHVPHQRGVPYYYSNEMWLTGPWRYVDIKMLSIRDRWQALEWPEALGCTLVFEDPIPMPLSYSYCSYTWENDWLFPIVHPTIRWFATGPYMGTIGATELPVRVETNGKLRVLGSYTAGSTRLSVERPHFGPAGQRRASPFMGIAIGDGICFEGNRSFYEIADVRADRHGNPSEITISPPLREPLVIDHGWNAIGDRVFNYGYWVPMRDEPLMLRCWGWTDPFGTQGVPIYVKDIKGNTVELLAPLAGDIQEGTKMYMWSSVENETMTYAYRDPYTYAYNIAFGRRVDELQEQITAHEAALDAESAQLNIWYGNAVFEARRRSGSLPYVDNVNLNDYYPGDWTFHDHEEDIRRRRIVIRKPRRNTVEFLSLLNYRSRL